MWESGHVCVNVYVASTRGRTICMYVLQCIVTSSFSCYLPTADSLHTYLDNFSI